MDDALGDNSGRAVPGRDGRHGAVLVIGHVVQAGHVDTRQLRGGAEEVRLAPPLAAGAAVQLDQLHGHVLALAQAHKVDEVGQRLGVVHGGAAGNDQRRQAGTVSGVEGDMRQIQHVEDGGKRHLVANGKGHDVEIRDGVAGFQREKGHIRLSQLLLHVAPRGEHTLAPDAGQVVHDAVENAHAQIGHADLIGVGEAEGDAGVHLVFVFQNGVIFAAHIAGGLLYAGQDAFQSFVHGKNPRQIICYNSLFYRVLFHLAIPHSPSARERRAAGTILRRW